jgi:hypothetical protein
MNVKKRCTFGPPTNCHLYIINIKKMREKMLLYKFSLYPNKEEEEKLLDTLEVCRKTYNRLLEEYNKGEHDRFKLQALLPVWKESDEDLRIVYAKASNMRFIACSSTRRDWTRKGSVVERSVS